MDRDDLEEILEEQTLVLSGLTDDAALYDLQARNVLDGGVLADGSPWLVTEFVDGRPIDQHATVNQLDHRARVDLLIDGLGEIRLGELEMVEPCLHLGLCPDGAVRLADAILQLQ